MPGIIKGTEVLTLERGWVPIESVDVGEYILGCDVDQRASYQKVRDTKIYSNQKLFTISNSNKKVIQVVAGDQKILDFYRNQVEIITVENDERYELDMVNRIASYQEKDLTGLTNNSYEESKRFFIDDIVNKQISPIMFNLNYLDTADAYSVISLLKDELNISSNDTEEFKVKDEFTANTLLTLYLIMLKSAIVTKDHNGRGYTVKAVSSKDAKDEKWTIVASNRKEDTVGLLIQTGFYIVKHNGKLSITGGD